MKRSIVVLLTLALGIPAVQAQSTQTAQASDGVSEVRIVRLSEARGVVQMDRNTGHGFEPAFANLPVTQGTKLRTTDGIAEVEFEDNSTLRLAPNAEVDFPTLNRSASGATASSVHVVKGTVYVSLFKATGPLSNTFTVISDRGDLILSPASHIRLAVDGPTTKFAVFDGTVKLKTATADISVPHKKGLLFASADQTTPTLVEKNDTILADTWDKNSVEYHKRYANATSLAGSPYLYGVADLNYYGTFTDLPGCGRVWQPYFTSASWAPYNNGIWAWYPGTGYTWVSVYPWGWAPFHYGSWQQCSSGGWGWRPGGQWTGLREPEREHHHPGDPGHHPHPPRPIRPPAPGESTMVAVNTRPLSLSKFDEKTQTFVFHKDSAGLGVPRDAFGKLAKTSNAVEQHGILVSSAYPAAERREYGTNRSAESGATGPHNNGQSFAHSGAGSTQSHTWQGGSERSGGGGGSSSHSSYSPPPSAPSAAPSFSPSPAPAAASHR